MSAKQERDGRKFGEQGRAAVAVLQSSGITEYQFTKPGKHAEVTFEVNGQPASYRFACTPRSPGGAAKTVSVGLQKMIRQLKANGTNGASEPVTVPQEGQDMPASVKPADRSVYASANAAAARRHRAWLNARLSQSKTLPTGKLLAEDIQITPDMAEIMLEHNTGNRRIVPSRVEKYASIISEGRWLHHGQGIHFSREGELLNGQHRLRAIVSAGMPVSMHVVFGEEKRAADIMDTGAVRQGSHIIAMRGHSYAPMIAAAARVLVYADGVVSINQRVDNDQLIQFLDDHSGMLDFVKDAHYLGTTLKCRPAPILAALYWIARGTSHRGRMEEFITSLREGTGLSKGSPILALREYLRNREYDSAVHNATTTAKNLTGTFVKAWNLWVKGRPGSQPRIRISSGDSIPLPE